MKIIIIFLLKLLATIFAGVIAWLYLLIAFILWDKRFLNLSEGYDFIWKTPKK